MEETLDANAVFVDLIEANKVVLHKSQVPSIKKKKEEAIDDLISKWTKAGGPVLTHDSLLKKIHNIKSRAKSASKKGHPLTPWQTKILEMIQANDGGTSSDVCKTKPNKTMLLDENDGDGMSTEMSEAEVAGPTDVENTEVEICKAEPKAEDFFKKLETEETKCLNNEQLQRVVLLKQIKVLTLQQQKLEHEINNPSPIMLDWSCLNASNADCIPL